MARRSTRSPVVLSPLGANRVTLAPDRGASSAETSCCAWHYGDTERCWPRSPPTSLRDAARVNLATEKKPWSAEDVALVPGARVARSGDPDRQ
jgi:hypothetical protein